MLQERIVSRRGLLTMAAGAGMTAWVRLYEEIDRLITPSPWAKEVTGQYSSPDVLDLSRDHKEGTLSTRLGRLVVKTKFNLLEMTYQGKLAV